MTELFSSTYTCFDNHQRIASGSLSSVALAVKRAVERGAAGPVLTFDDMTGRVIDIDTRGSDADILSRLPQPAVPDETAPETEPETGRGRGRPKLGVVPREVTLLPRHWEWLAKQPGGASVALRKLVEEARRANTEKDKTKQSQECAYRFMSAIAGNMTDFEEASRALFANDPQRFREFTSAWPDDVRDYAIQLAFGEDATLPENRLSED